MEGRLTRMAGSLQSIMDRHHQEEAGHTTGWTLKKDTAMWDWDLTTGQLFWSSQLGQLFGSSMDTSRPLTLNDWLAGVHPDDRERFGSTLLNIKDLCQDNILLTHRIMRNTSSPLRIAWSGQVIRDHEKQPVHTLGTVEILDNAAT